MVLRAGLTRYGTYTIPRLAFMAQGRLSPKGLGGKVALTFEGK